MNQYEQGNTVTVTASFTDVEAAAYDPDTVFLEVKRPDGQRTRKQYSVDVDVTRTATGQYTSTFDVDLVGTWDYRWYSTDSPKASKSGVFSVTRARTS